jgi:hypothetical protein
MPVSDLSLLLKKMDPVLNPGVYVFCVAPPGADLRALEPIGLFREREGVTAIVEERRALEAKLPISYRAGWITLNVPSDLNAVGFTAAFSSALGAAGISCNVVAAVHHDHVFVPAESAQRALEVLLQLRDRA